jgi:AcrR family transcriptional regulator
MKNGRLTQEQKRARIVDQASTLFRQFGPTKTTVSDIAVEMHMSPANIYKFFPSKDAIIQAGADQELIQMRANLQKIARSRRKPTERLLHVVLSIYQFHREYFRNERQIYKLVTAATENNWSCVCAFKKFLFDLVREIIDAGVVSGEFRALDAVATTEVLLNSFTWITNPILLPQLEAKRVEAQARAQISLLERALK